MEPVKGWTLSVRDGLRAHFLQSGGPSKPGTDWAVKLSLGNQNCTVFVRAYTDDVAGTSPRQETQLVLGYVARLLESGWSPASYSGKPGELVYAPAAASTGKLPTDTPRPWWRFW
jgi:hypothetical protein